MAGGARELDVLGPTTVRSAGVTVPLRPRERDVLAALALEHPHPVPTEKVVALLWPVAPPATARVTVQNHVSRLRQTLGADAVLTERTGYRLGPSWALDLSLFIERLERGRRHAMTGDHAAARAQLEQAGALVRGDAFADLEECPAVLAARARWREQAAGAAEEVVLLLLTEGSHAHAVAEAQALVAAAPDREHRWAILALALYRDGQRRAGIRAIGEGRRALRTEAGIEIGPALTALESLILADDPRLLTAPPASLTGHRSDWAAPPARAFVGRTEELEEVLDRLRGVIDDRTAASIAVVGEEGIGKTALAGQVAARAVLDGWQVVSAACAPTPTRPLDPLGDVVRQILELEPSPEDVFPKGVLEDLESLWLDTDSPPRGDVGRAILEVVRRHAERWPTLLVLDDAHHLQATAKALIDQIGRMPVAVATLLSKLPDAHDGPGSIALGGLDPEDTGRLLEHLTGEDVAPAMARAVHKATGGGPEGIRQAAERTRGIGTGEDESSEPVGSWLVEALIDIDPAGVAVAEMLAEAGGRIPLDVLAEALPQVSSGRLGEVVAQCVSTGLLTQSRDSSVGIADRRLEQALGARLADPQKADLREALGLAFLERGLPLAAAPHLLAVAERDPVRAIDAAERAARAAADVAMNAEAAQVLEQAVAVARSHFGSDHARHLRLRLGWAEMLRRAGDPRVVDVAWQTVRAAEAIGDDELVAVGAATLCSLGPLTRAGTLDQDLAELVERAVARCPSDATRAICAGQATLFYSMTGAVDRCSAHFREALSSARRTGDDRVLLDALGCVYVSLTHPDELELRHQLAEEMLMLAGRLDDDDARFQALHLYFSNQVQRPDPLLRATFAQQEQIAERLRSPGRLWMVGYQRACVAHLEGRLEDVMAISSENLERAPVDQSRALSNHWMWTLLTKLAEGRGQDLAGEIDQIIATQPGLPGWRAVAAWLAALRGDAERVQREVGFLDRGAALPRDMVWGAATMLLGRAVAMCGDAADQRILLDRLRPFSGLMTWWGSGTIGSFDQALAELALASGDLEAAWHHHSLAQRSIDRLQATVYQDDLDELAARLRSDAAPAEQGEP